MFHVSPSKSRPVIGSILSQPAETWPSLFGTYKFFHQYPYFLPCAAAGLLAFISGTIAFLSLKEVSIDARLPLRSLTKVLEFASCYRAREGQAAENV